MEVTASTRYASVSPRKVRLVLDHLPGQSVRDVLNMLKFLPSPHAKAENNYAMDPDVLFVKRAVADEARSLPRFRPAARGRIRRYKRRTSHITIVVDERES
jgi:large subunit ribosomal protein L22